MRQKIILLVEPAGKGRPRLTSRGRAYTPEKTASKEAEIRYWLHHQKDMQHMGEGPLRVELDFYFTKPKSAKNRPYPTVKPDIDNVIKMVLDSCNKILFEDDKQIVECNARKLYGEPSRIEMTLEML